MNALKKQGSQSALFFFLRIITTTAPPMAPPAITTIATTPANGIGQVCGMVSVSSTSPHTVQRNSLVPVENAPALLVTVHSPSSCPVAGIVSLYVSPQTEQVYVVLPSSVQVASVVSVTS